MLMRKCWFSKHFLGPGKACKNLCTFLLTYILKRLSYPPRFFAVLDCGSITGYDAGLTHSLLYSGRKQMMRFPKLESLTFSGRPTLESIFIKSLLFPRNSSHQRTSALRSQTELARDTNDSQPPPLYLV